MLYEKIQLEPNEEVLKVVRKHWFIIVSELFGTFLMLLAPFFMIFFIMILPFEFIPDTIHLESHLPLIIYIVSIWSLMALMTGFMIWTHYYLDLWIITDRRIIVIDQVRFFDRQVSSFRLERLQDIRYSIDGLIATFLKFGTIRAQTAGMGENSFKTTGLPDPRELQSIIQKATDARLGIINEHHHTH
ncbi:MAG: PH domain-containing protein [Candidatus Nomurabacteria bacterium]|nr:PH domain-containing protein [Candidatus Nomurabacteria bacterium]USN88051.1 MAG: PH domain-containing protein [Candidatus Nomurabacteria bacterium]